MTNGLNSPKAGIEFNTFHARYSDDLGIFVFVALSICIHTIS